MMPNRERVENWGKLAWVPILAVSSLSLLVSFCNYHYQTGYQPPTLEFTNGDVGSEKRFLRLWWQNTGKSIAWHGQAKLFLEGSNSGRATIC